jgi:predicted nucleic acid-binding protein
MYLLDTVVLSETRKARPNPSVIQWLRSVPPESLYLSVVTLGEIEKGIERQRKTNPTFSAALEEWLDVTMKVYADRLLSITPSIARRWGLLSAHIGHDGADLLIAATALDAGLTVVTRNTTHFVPTGVAVFNPFEPA